MKLGKFKAAELREYWKNEVEFTRWLAEPENLELLSDEVGIGILNPRTEANVGRFAVDILAEEENTGKNIVIENQLEMTDHLHLGQLITYAAGLEAEFVIWIVREAREEHRQACDWLNEHTDEHINFFLVLSELWQIGDSPAAMKFKIISRPNEWRRLVRKGWEGELTSTKAKQLEFWQQLKDFAGENYPKLKLRSPRPQHWFDVAIGRSDCHVSLIVDSRENQVRCELYIPDSKDLYQTLLVCRDQIEKELDVAEPVEWQDLPGKKASRIRTMKDFQFDDIGTWAAAFGWMTETCIKFKRVFAKNWSKRLGQPAEG
jgi:hypothetical protein